MQEHIKFDEMGEDVYYILEQNGEVLNVSEVEVFEKYLDGSAREINVRQLTDEGLATFTEQYQFIRNEWHILSGFTESIIQAVPTKAKRSDRYRMILTRCPDEWLEEDEIREWLG